MMRAPTLAISSILSMMGAKGEYIFGYPFMSFAMHIIG